MEPIRTISVRLSYIARLLRRRFDQRAKSLGLTRAQWQTIGTIRFHPGATQREVAERLEVGSVSVGRVIERLESAGWIERRPDPGDRRAYRLYLRPDVAPRLEELGALGRDEERRALRGLSEEEIAAFTATLDHVIRNLESPHAGLGCAAIESEAEADAE